MGVDTLHAVLATLCILPVLFSLAFCEENMEYKLVRDLMRDYDKRIRPAKVATEALNVTFGLALAQIIDVDEKNQIITTNCWLNQAWMDYKLKWDPEDYGNMTVVRLPASAIWKPDILLYNNADVSSYGTSVSTNMIVTHDGNVTWLSMIIFKSSCAIDVKYFPFDEQNCSLLFASWSYDGFQLNIKKVGDDGDVSNYITNSEWLLLKLHAVRNVVYYSCCEEPYPDVTYTIQIRRKPLFYVFNMILPCCIITLVALLGFYIPSDSGEKVTMGITTLLSMTVFLMLVAESMPPTSDVLPLIGLYYGITIAIVSFATAMTVLTLNIHHKGLRGTEVPPLVKKICFGFLAKLFCLTLDSPESLEPPFFDGKPDTLPSNHVNHHNNSSYMKLHPCERQSSAYKHYTGRFTGNSHNTVLDYIPSTDLNSASDGYEKYEMQERFQENGGIPNRFNHFRHHTGTGSASTSTSLPSDSNFEKQFVITLQQVCKTIEKNEIRLADQDRRDYIKMEWQQVALVVDRLLLGLFIIGTVGVTFGIILNAPHSLGFFLGWEEKGLVEGD